MLGSLRVKLLRTKNPKKFNTLGTNHGEYKEPQQSNQQEGSHEVAGKLPSGNRILRDLALNIDTGLVSGVSQSRKRKVNIATTQETELTVHKIKASVCKGYIGCVI